MKFTSVTNAIIAGYSGLLHHMSNWVYVRFGCSLLPNECQSGIGVRWVRWTNDTAGDIGTCEGILNTSIECLFRKDGSGRNSGESHCKSNRNSIE